MMKEKKLIIILSVIALIIIGLVLIGINAKVPQNGNKVTDTQNANFVEGTFNNIKLPNDLELNFESVEEIEGDYYLTMIANNNTDDAIDLSNYRISFQDNNSNEIEWIRGTAVGVVEAQGKVRFTIQISGNKDIKNVSKIIYREYDFPS